MSDTSDARTERYSGDVRLAGSHEAPVDLRGAADVFVGPDGVAGTLRLADAEYVYTDVVPPGDGGTDPAESPPAVATEVTGDIEDGYVENADGDVVIRDVEDVFVASGAAEAVDPAGAEQVFHDGAATPTEDPAGYDVTVTGWDHTRDARDPRDGVSVRGAKNTVEVTEGKHDLTVYVVGWDNEVRIEGRGVDATVFFVGRDNRVSVGPYVSATTAAESGFDNVVDSDPVPPEAVVQTSKEEAHADATVGRHRITWQEPAPDKDWCPNCGEDADAVIARRQKDAFFLFGTAVRTYDDGGVSYECERCSRHVAGDVALDADERRDALR
ncbi:DUF3060 domain-containing protein [Halosimplex pelagicum]|uniref:DUF3060 domain-containing protein n=1 Tax=Halosimplex pelagicum TaxID=869886 RepID=A0A7D5SUM4_9EURY|nr:DUF3060 domain-containing protein [Halosimplex pelagicum]QLH81467.1 DUF3060 domain-containing protein [Halosimplex pelagicum]